MKAHLAPWVWIAAVGFWRSAEAAADCAPASKTFTIKTARDASDISSCSQFTGNIVVAADGPENISLNGIKSVTGNIDIENVAKLRSLSSTSLEAVSSFTLNNLPQFSNLSLPALSNFSSFKWYNLPSLQGCTVATGALQGEIQEITIVNTSIKSLDWLKWPIGSQLNISSNANLRKFTIPYATINAGSALSLCYNPALESIDTSSLGGIYGGLQISDNNGTSALSFEKLQTIAGFVQLSGEFANVSMPALNGINGALSVKSTGDISALCDNLQKKRLQGHYDCTPNVEKSPASTRPTGTTSVGSRPTATMVATATAPAGGKSKGLSISVIAGLTLGAITFLILSTIALFILLRRRIRSRVREIPKDPSASSPSPSPSSSSPSPSNLYELSESGESTSSFPKELETRGVRLEMATRDARPELPGVVPSELDAAHGRSELNTPVASVRSCARSSWASAASARSNVPLVRHELPA